MIDDELAELERDSTRASELVSEYDFAYLSEGQERMIRVSVDAVPELIAGIRELDDKLARERDQLMDRCTALIEERNHYFGEVARHLETIAAVKGGLLDLIDGDSSMDSYISALIRRCEG